MNAFGNYEGEIFSLHFNRNQGHIVKETFPPVCNQRKNGPIPRHTKQTFSAAFMDVVMRSFPKGEFVRLPFQSNYVRYCPFNGAASRACNTMLGFLIHLGIRNPGTAIGDMRITISNSCACNLTTISELTNCNRFSVAKATTTGASTDNYVCYIF